MTDKMARALRIVERLPQLDQDDFARRLLHEIAKAHRAAQCNRLRTTSASTAPASA